MSNHILTCVISGGKSKKREMARELANSLYNSTALWAEAGVARDIAAPWAVDGQGIKNHKKKELQGSEDTRLRLQSLVSILAGWGSWVTTT